MQTDNWSVQQEEDSMKLILKGNSKYINRMYKHLRKEHPSTKPSMRKV